MIEIKSRFTGKVLFSGDFQNIRLALKAAIEAKADLTDADLARADLTDADLTRADLTGADLTGADLTGAVLTGADLTGAVLTGADLTGADLTPIRDDIWAVLSAAPKEVPALRQALIDGKVDGSCYRGECACLVGTLANAAKIDVHEFCVKPNHRRPAEKFFMGINEGDTPETNAVSKQALQWVDEWLTNMRAAFAVPV